MRFRTSWYSQTERVLMLLVILVVSIWMSQQLQSHWWDLYVAVGDLWHKGTELFSVVETSFHAVLSPSIIALAIALGIVQLFPVAPPFSARLAVVSVLLSLAVRYVFWRLFATLNFTDSLQGGLSLVFLIAELLGLVVNLGSLWLMVVTVNRSPQAERLSQAVISGDFCPWVDVWIPTYNEPEELLRRTIIGCQAMDYPHKRVYLLDDQRRAGMRSLAEELGCTYICRPDNRHAKAGNLNNALRQTDGDLIVVFDADFIPTKDFLTRTVGFFQDNKVALVQTPQNFYNGDPIKHNLGLPSFTNDQDFFFRKMQLGRDATNTVICCGSCFIIRRRNLENIGGIPTETLCEDLLTSLQLQAAGYKVLYLNEALSAGAAAEDVGGYVDQRLRWGQGTLQTLLVKTNPLTMPGLNFWQRFFQSLGIFYWVTAGFQVLFLLLPLIYMVFGLTPLVADLNSLLYFWVPYYVVNVATFAWLNDRKRSVFWADVYTNIICFPVALMVVKMLHRPFAKGFKVTPKGVVNQGVRVNWIVVRPLLVVLGLYIVAIALHLLGVTWQNQPHLNSVNYIWGAYNICILILTIQVAIDVPQEVMAINFPHEIPSELTVAGETIYSSTVKLSQKGTTLKLASKSLLTRFPATGLLNLPSLNLIDLPVNLTKIHRGVKSSIELELEFAKLTLPQERKLIEFLFCRPGQWKEDEIHETKSFFAFWISLFRFYPLIEGNARRS
jgi:cellulose synthase (UDP-forming)